MEVPAPACGYPVVDPFRQACHDEGSRRTVQGVRCVAASACQIGGRLSRCHNTAENVCQYCGHRFCPTHRYYVEGFEAVCSRPRCRAKRDDMVMHSEYAERVRQRNGAGLCGVEECGPRPEYECSLCQGRFCERHVAAHVYPVREGRIVVGRPVSVCEHCWQRRKIWRR